MNHQVADCSGAQGLKTAKSVRYYLERGGPQDMTDTFQHLVRVQQMKGGATNYAYRVAFQPSQSEPEAESTVVLKYAPEYAIITPDVPLTSDRQVFEASAVQDLGPMISQDSSNSLVKLPQLLFHDPVNNVIIMEDVGIVCGGNSAEPLPSVMSLETLCRSPIIRSEDLPVTSDVGQQLGRFIFRLHQLGRDANRSDIDQLRQRFRCNVAARRLDVDTTFGEIIGRLEEYDVDLGAAERLKLKRVIDEMSQAMMDEMDTILMGDFWYGNVMVKLKPSAQPAALQSIYVIDWEFATCGPAFVDLAHFASEVWLQDRFSAANTPAATANRNVAIALFSSYRDSGGVIDDQRIVYYIGGHICCFLAYADWTQDSQTRKKVAQEGLDLILQAEAGNWDAIKENAFMKDLLAL